MIPGELGLVYLTALDRDNAEQTREWLNDPAVARWFVDELVPNSKAKQLEMYDEADKGEKLFMLEIHATDDDRYLGIVGFETGDIRHRQAEFGIAIGPVDERGKGFGRDATLTCLRWGFDTLGLHCVWLGALDDNEHAIPLYRDIGFRELGRIREQVLVEGSFHDVVYFDMLEDEFRARYGSRG